MLCITSIIVSGRAAPDGYVAFVFRPNSAKDNDATILNDIFSDERCGGRVFPNEVQTLLKGDIFLADRGFRDSATTKERRGITLHVPSGIKKGKKQTETRDAN